MEWFLLASPWLNLSTAVVFLLALYVSYWYLCERWFTNLPPGPPVLPIIGSLPWMTGSDIREVLYGMRAKYGKMFTIYLAGRRTVILGDMDLVKDAFIKQNHRFINRPQDLFFVKEITKGGGVVFSNGRRWREQRALVHHVFREFGVGTTILEGKILEECEPMINALSADQGPVDPKDIVQMAVANIVGNIAWGARNEYNDPEFQQFIESIDRSCIVCGSVEVLTLFPKLKHLPGDLFQYHRLLDTVAKTDAQLWRFINYSKETHVKGVTRSVIDFYLNQIEKSKNDPESTYTEYEMFRVICDLLGAGTETTTTTLLWTIVYMLRYPDCYARVQEEVDDTIGTSQLPSLHDKLRMPYTEACLLEIQRLADIVPLGVPRETTQTFNFHGYDLPKGTTVMPFLFSIHRDPEIFPEPYQFNPDRFLDAEGQVYGRERIIPFSVGKRNCAGEALARMELFLVFTSMIQKLKFELPEGHDPPEETGKIGVVHHVEPFQVIFTRR